MLRNLKIILPLSLLLVPLTFVSGQSDVSPEAKLVRHYESGCGSSCAQELAIDLGGIYGKSPDDMVAIRFCSTESLARALTTSAAAFGYVSEILEGSYGYTPERIMFLRSADCAGSDPAISATEFWIVHKGIPFPTSVESIKSCQVQFKTFGVRGTFKSMHRFRAALRRIPRILKSDSDATAVINGNYIRNPSSALRRAVSEARIFLERSGLPPDRYAVHLLPWTGEYEIGEPEIKYPSISIVRMLKTCERR